MFRVAGEFQQLIHDKDGVQCGQDEMQEGILAGLHPVCRLPHYGQHPAL